MQNTEFPFADFLTKGIIFCGKCKVLDFFEKAFDKKRKGDYTGEHKIKEKRQ
ncbi:MAG: hypothetical protein ACLT5X_05030 [Blautia producta]|nr:hypothetical protein [uncultured Blautia sp.]